MALTSCSLCGRSPLLPAFLPITGTTFDAFRADLIQKVQAHVNERTAAAADTPAEPTGASFSGPGIRIVWVNGLSFDAASFAALDDREDASVWIVASAVAVTSDVTIAVSDACKLDRSSFKIPETSLTLQT